MVKKLTTEDRKQLKQDIIDGKVSMDDLYEKCKVYPPYMMPYEHRGAEYKNMTKEEYLKQIADDEIEDLLCFYAGPDAESNNDKIKGGVNA